VQSSLWEKGCSIRKLSQLPNFIPHGVLHSSELTEKQFDGRTFSGIDVVQKNVTEGLKVIQKENFLNVCSCGSTAEIAAQGNLR
jgi:hypothetical protein